MRYAIFSDIHANLEALEAVLAKIDELKQKRNQLSKSGFLETWSVMDRTRMSAY